MQVWTESIRVSKEHVTGEYWPSAGLLSSPPRPPLRTCWCNCGCMLPKKTAERPVQEAPENCKRTEDVRVFTAHIYSVHVHFHCHFSAQLLGSSLVTLHSSSLPFPQSFSTLPGNQILCPDPPWLLAGPRIKLSILYVAFQALHVPAPSLHGLSPLAM